MTFTNLRISTKILSVLGLFTVLVIGIAAFGSVQISNLADKTQDLVNDQAESQKIAGSANASAAKLHQLYLERIIEANPERIPPLMNEIAEERKTYMGLIAALKPFIDGPDVARFAQVMKAIADYDQLVEPIEMLLRSGQRDKVLADVQIKGGDAYQQMDDAFDAIVKQQDDDLDAAAAEAGKGSSKSLWTLLIVSLVGLSAAIVAGLTLVRRQITGPLGALESQMGEIAGGDYRKDVAGIDRGDEIGAMAKAVRVFRENGIAKQAADEAKAQADAEQKMVVDTVSTHLSDLSDGDLTATITVDFPRDYGVLKANFNEALGKLRELIGAVSESAATIRTGSGEIAQASEDLARRTESNAASLEETAASVTQMDGRLKASAEAASRTVERADQAIATVGGGRAVADEAVQAMGRVSDSAKGIDSVIEGLDKIAFQTRVLAMNAAVEAGRAGDAGRGFAVVADLVSALAMRAEEEAKRARDQLTVTQTDIVTAVEAVTKVDGALANISGDVGQVHELLATMAADNQAQSAAITQISSAIGTMDQATQQNAAMVEETSAAARNLAAEVGGLSEQAGRFNIGTVATTAPRAVRAATATPALAPVPAKPRKADARAYASPVKPLPAAGVAALVRADDDWNAF